MFQLLRGALRTCIVAASLTACTAFGPAAAAPVTQCRASETIVFSCSTGSQILSICASKDLSKNAGYMQYRYGPAGKPQLVFPETLRHPAGLFTPGTLVFSGGGGAYLKFSKPPYVYTVFSAIGNFAKRGKGTAGGVAVQKDDQEFANIPCRRDGSLVEGELGPDYFEKASLGEPESDFDIPLAFLPK
jgi:hypothetical protein